MLIEWLLYGIVFSTYFGLHSLLASLRFKKWVFSHWPGLQKGYRILFNALSLLLLIPLLLLLWRYPGDMLWQWQGWQAYLANGLAIAALIGFYFSLADYDLADFFGWRQWRHPYHQQNYQEIFHIGRFHRYIRHPWYFFLLILLWTRDMSEASLLVTVLATLYIIIGAWLEEQKLMIFFGDTYRRYRQHVPGLLPLPWKYLTVLQAKQLVQNADSQYPEQ